MSISEETLKQILRDVVSENAEFILENFLEDEIKSITREMIRKKEPEIRNSIQSIIEENLKVEKLISKIVISYLRSNPEVFLHAVIKFLKALIRYVLDDQYLADKLRKYL